MELFPRPHHKEVFASHLKWQVLDPFAEKSFGNDQITQWMAEGNRFTFTYKNGSDVNMGVTSVVDFEEHKNSKIYSLAAKAATSKRFRKTTSLILVTNTESPDEGVFAIGIVSGNIVIDELIPLEQVHDIYDNFVGLCENTGRLFFTHGDVRIHDQALNHSFTLSELLDDKHGKKILIEPLRNEKKLLYIVYGVLALILFFAAWKAWDWYHEEAQQQIRDRLESQKSPAYLYAQAALLHLNKGALVLPEAGQQIIDMVEKFPARSGGWILESLKCDSEKCEAHWLSEGGTYADFKAHKQPEWGDLIYNSGDKDVLGDLRTIQFSFPHKLEKQKLPPASNWPTADDFTFQTGVEWQKLKVTEWKARLGPAQLQAVPQGMNPTALQSHPQALYAMPWDTSNQSWPTIKRVLPTFPENAVLKTFDIRLDKVTRKVSFNASGLAYVKK